VLYEERGEPIRPKTRAGTEDEMANIKQEAKETRKRIADLMEKLNKVVEETRSITFGMLDPTNENKLQEVITCTSSARNKLTEAKTSFDNAIRILKCIEKEG
jgi:C4-type Zn-finger protein